MPVYVADNVAPNTRSLSTLLNRLYIRYLTVFPFPFKRYVADKVAPQIRQCDIDGVTRPPELVPETLRWMAGVYLAQAQQVRVAETIVKEENAYITTKGI